MNGIASSDTGRFLLFPSLSWDAKGGYGAPLRAWA
jgi:hypothetical protein